MRRRNNSLLLFKHVLLCLPALLILCISGTEAAGLSPSMWPGEIYSVAGTYVVNSVGDAGDSNPGDGICSDSVGNCTLRAAIQEANSHSGEDAINFGIGSGPQTITPAGGLPAITDPVTIAGTTQPGCIRYPCIEISGGQAGNASSLVLRGGSSTVQGLVLNGFLGSGIYITVGGGNTVVGNYIGTTMEGTAAVPNLGHGIQIQYSSNNVIGGTSPALRNVISGNGGGNAPANGVLIASDDIGGPPAANNQVLGNYIGTDHTGTLAVPNSGSGVEINYDAASNTVGGAASGAGNLLSGNSLSGVVIDLYALDNRITGNLIGTNASGLQPLANGMGGVSVFNAGGTAIGGTSAAERNIVSGNAAFGIRVSRQQGYGTQIVGNFIGTDISGSAGLPNGGTGILIDDSASNILVGGTTAGAGNVICANQGRGLWLYGSSTNTVFGNYIGLNHAGAPMGNGGDGVYIEGRNNAIGGPDPGQGNTIAYNNGSGVAVGYDFHNPIRANAIFSNAALGIDLNDDGVTANDVCDSDGGPNELENYPVLSSATVAGNSTTLTGTLNSRSTGTYRIEFFSNLQCGPAGMGEGQTFIGSTIVTTNANCESLFTVVLPVAVPAGSYVTSTDTDAVNNTSEFSACLLVTASATTSTPTPTSAATTHTASSTSTSIATSTRTYTPTPELTPTCTAPFYVVPSPNMGSAENILRGVFARSSTDIWAVGEYAGASNIRGTLIEHWDGAQWVITPSPSQGSNDNRLYGVSATAPDDAWAVGYAGAQTLIEHWNGSQWQVAPAPAANGGLFGVVALSTSNVWAVGNVDGRAFTEQWNGTQWSIVATPDPGAGSSSNLYGVSALSSSDMWAVGYFYDAGSTQRTLALHWDGLQWSVVPTPNVGNNPSRLNAVYGMANGDAWAAGFYNDASQGPRTLIEHWDGAQWQITPSPNNGTDYNYLFGISGDHSGNVWAVGYYYSTTATYYRTLVERWDGTQWSIYPSANNSPTSSYLYAVSALPSGELWAAGYFHNPGTSTYQTLVERYLDLCTSPTSTITTTPTMPATSPTATPSTSPIIPASATRTASPTGTNVHTSTSTATPTTPVLTPCTIQFSDVPPTGPGSTFYSFTRCMACRGIISGYSCGGPGEPCNSNNDKYFRPGVNVTRGQISKMVALAAHLSGATGNQIFEDVLPASTFYDPIQQLASRGYIGGYPCGQVGTEPCGISNRAYFRPGTNTTRGQLSKIVSQAAGFLDDPGAQQFADVSPGSPFFVWINRLALRYVIGGYPCGGPDEPCDTQSRPYFRASSQVTRGQTAKIVANTFYPNCDTPARP